MKRFCGLLLILLSGVAFGQEIPTMFILVRHAEKDMKQSTNDPDLSEAGKKRADKLAHLLEKTNITAIYSSNYKRTRQTVEPLARSKTLEVQTYVPNKEEDIDMMLAKNKGGTVVVAGHSNTIPQFANYLLGESTYHTFEDGDYGNILIVSVVKKGEGVKVVWVTTD
ncbi:phosphoglycerate mutase family protein [Oscillatoria amoena NRMC-F 0135]|nr:phosphoglycerate mutase family protein [Oscillatoria amoena NRMC-F 0135]